MRSKADETLVIVKTICGCATCVCAFSLENLGCAICVCAYSLENLGCAISVFSLENYTNIL